MASKKCPKCGEDNPAEAVMCWACYTPLTAGAAMGAAATMTPGSLAQGPMGKAGPMPVPDDAGAKKTTDPKLFVLIGLIAVGGAVAAFMNMGSPPAEVPTDDPPVTEPGGEFVTPPQAPPPGPPVAGPPPGPTTQNPSAVPQAAAPYSIKSAPNPELPTGTVGIVATQPTLTPGAARGLAKFAYNQISRGGNWKDMQIAVFTNDGAAKSFAVYQAKRRNARLTAGDYQILAGQNVWASAPVFYETRGRGENIRYPSVNPNSWWSGR